MGDLVPVRLRERVQVRGGGLLHPGEVAWLTREEAADLVARGVGVAAPPAAAVETAATAVVEVSAVKAPAGPPADKMLRETSSRKK